LVTGSEIRKRRGEHSIHRKGWWIRKSL